MYLIDTVFRYSYGSMRSMSPVIIWYDSIDEFGVLADEAQNDLSILIFSASW